MAAGSSTPAPADLSPQRPFGQHGWDADGGGLYNRGIARPGLLHRRQQYRLLAGAGVYVDLVGQPAVLIGTELKAQQGRRHVRPGLPALIVATSGGPDWP